MLIWSRTVSMPLLSWSFIARTNFQPAPMPKAVRVDSQLYHLSRKPSHCNHCAATMLIPLYSLIDIMSNDASSVDSHTNYIFELLIFGCLPPVFLSLATCQNICVELIAKFIQTINLCPLCEAPQTIEVFHNHSDAIVRLIPGCFSICRLAQKISNLPRDLILSRLLV